MIMKKIVFLLLLSIFHEGSAQNTCEPVIDDGLIAFYPFCGNPDDASGHGFNGTVVGASLTSDRFNNSNSAYDFDGSGHYISIPQLTASTDQAFTVCVWLLNRKDIAGMNGIYHGAASGEWVVYNNGFGVHLTDGNWYTCDIGVFDTVWTHVAGIYEKGSKIKLFVNGEPLSQTDLPGYDLFEAAGYNSSIGAYNNGVTNFWQGGIDDIYVFNRKLSADEIDSVYHQGEWTGINGQGKLNELTVFPNPSDGRLSIVTGRITKWDVKIFNSTGELVNSLVLPVNEGVADITELKPGLYYLLAQDGSRRIVRKIVIR
jgi:hypothetical protein